MLKFRMLYKPLVNICGPILRSYQWESPFFNRINWSVNMHDSNGPTIAPSNGGSLKAPVYTSTFSASLWNKNGNPLKIQIGIETQYD